MSKHPHHFRPAALLPWSEARPCRMAFDSPEYASEALAAGEEILRNPVLKQTLQFYNSADILKKYPEIKSADDREFFFSLVINGILPDGDRPRYGNVKDRKDVKIADPINLVDRFPDDKDLGAYIIDRTPEKLVTDLAGVARPMPMTDDYREKVGKAIRKKIQDDQKDWETKKGAEGLPNTMLAELAIHHYLYCKKELQKMLDAQGIKLRQIEREADLIAGNTLARDEYLALLTLMWNGKEAEVAAMVGKKLPGIRTDLNKDENKKIFKRVIGVYTDVSVGQLGPQETLNRFGIVIGPIVLRDYALHRVGKLPGKIGVINDSASTWIDHPQRAYEFLNGRIVATNQNTEFLRALRYHLVLDDDARAAEERTMGKPKLDKDDTRAILSLIIQTLVRREQVIQRTTQEREDFRKHEGFDEKVERHAGDMWEYIKGVREHPVGSILLGLGAFIVVRKLWKTVFGKGEGKEQGVRNIWRYLFYAGLGVAGITLYQKHQYGDSTVEQLMRKWGKNAPTWLGGDKEKKPEEQTLPQYWQNQLQKPDPEVKGDTLSQLDVTYCISLLQEQKVDAVVRWYEDADRAMRTDPKQIPTMPFAIRNKDRFFGSKTNKEIATIFYFTMRRFFTHRGATLDRDPVFKDAGGNADRGLAYIRMKYLALRDMTVLAEFRKKFKVEVDGKEIDLTTYDIKPEDFVNPKDPTLKKLKEVLDGVDPNLYKRILTGVLIFKEMTKPANSKDWQMSEVFLLEADPAVLGKTNKDAGNFLAQIQREAEDIEKAPILPPGPIRPDVVIHPKVFVHDGIVLGPKSVLPEGVVFPPKVMPPGFVLPPAKVAPGVTLPPGFIAPPGLVLPPGSIIKPGIFIPPPIILPPAVLNGVVLPPGAVAPPGTVIAAGSVFPAGTQFPPPTFPKGTPLAPAIVHPDVVPTLPPGFVPPPGTILPKGTVIKPGTVIPPALEER